MLFYKDGEYILLGELNTRYDIITSFILASAGDRTRFDARRDAAACVFCGGE